MEMNIAISGSTGFIGSNLSSFLKDHGYNVVSLTRKILDDDVKLRQVISRCNVVINLAGANIMRRWSNEYKNKILRSRIDVTHKIVTTINYLNHKPELFISASAVGIYPTDIIYDENTQIIFPDTFLAKVAQSWENEALKCDKSTRMVICRFGVVLDQSGGALKQIKKSYTFKTAVTFSNSNNFFPWISLEDVCNSILFIIENENIDGIVNMVSPQIITYNHIVRALNKKYKPLIKIKIPFCIVELLMGENSQVLAAGQMVNPSILISNGYKYITPKIEDFTRDS